MHRCTAIRLAEEVDVPALAAIEASSHVGGGNWNTAQVAEELYRERATVLVEDRDGETAGWIVTWHVPPDELHILEVAVSPDHRRQGIATSLLRAALGVEYRQDAMVALLEVRESNTAAKELYEKLGFEVVGTRPRFYSDGEGAILMNCELNEWNF